MIVLYAQTAKQKKIIDHLLLLCPW